MIKLARNLTLPDDAVTQTFACLAVRGAGKTYTAGVLVEKLLKAKAQVVVFDPIGTWWGLRLKADGRSAGFDIPVFGGFHGDVPLEPTGGPVVAETLVTTRTPVVLDVSTMRKSQRRQLLTDLAEELFYRQKQDRTPLHIVLEEAQSFVPQRINKGEERMLGAFEDIVLQGRNFGLGVTLISQRPQAINKGVLNQTECLILGRLIGKHERKAIEEWVEAKGVDLSEAMDELPSLPTDQKWVWSPSWLQGFKRVSILKKQTYDASATPTVGQRQAAGQLKTLDLDRIRDAMQESIEKARQSDPKALRDQNTKLRRKLDELERTLAQRPAEPQIREVSALSDEQRQFLQDLAAEIDELLNHTRSELGDLQEHAKRLVALPGALGDKAEQFRQATAEITAALNVGSTQHRPSEPDKGKGQRPEPWKGEDDPTWQLRKAERNVLRAFYWLQGETANKAKVSFYSGYSSNSSSLTNAISKLRSLGLIHGWQITTLGQSRVPGDVGRKPTGPELREWLRPKLGRAENAILDALISAAGNRLTKAEIAQQTGYSATSSSLTNALSRLRTLDAAEGNESAGGTKAADVFFTR